MNLTTFRDRWVGFGRSRRGKAMTKASRWLILLGVLGYLGFELSSIGWVEIWRALPTDPLFYVLFLVLYFSLPLAEVFIYRFTWKFRIARSFPAFVKKRIYNKEIIGYSGEVYLFSWARRNVAVGDRRILETIRDNNIVSSVASTFVASALLAVFLYEGAINVGDWIESANMYYLAGGALVLSVLAVLGIRFRRFLFSMPARTALVIFGVHVLRLVVGQGLQILQWEVAVVEVSWQAWFTLAAASIIVSRIPVLPNRDLVFLGAGVELSHVMSAPAAAIASMLLVTTVLGKVLNLVLFATAGFYDRMVTGPNGEGGLERVLEEQSSDEPVPA